MPLGRASAARSLDPSPALPKKGSYVQILVDGKKIQGTVISQEKSGIVLSERGRFGSPEIHDISSDRIGRFVQEEIKLKPARKDAVSFVDQYRIRSLQNESRDDEGQNNLDFSVKGYDAKTDMFYVQGVLNGSTFGKWVSAKEAMPAIDPKTAGGDKNRGDIIKSFAGAVGTTESLAERFPKKPLESSKEPSPESTKEARSDLSGAEERKRNLGKIASVADTEADEDILLAEETPSSNVIPLVRPVAVPLAAGVVAADAAAKQSTAKSNLSERPTEKRSSTDQVNERLAVLRGKKAANDNAAERTSVGDASSGTHTTAQAAREAVILTDASLVSPELLPTVIRQYANAAGGAALGIDSTTWTQALRQSEEISRQQTTRVQEREQQYQQLLRLEAAPSLLAESESRLSMLKQAQVLTRGTLESAQSRRSASELAKFQSTRHSSASPSSSGAGSQGAQQTLDALRARGGAGSQTQIQAQFFRGTGTEQGSGATGASIAVPVLNASTRAGEMGYEQQLASAFAEGVQALESRLAELDAQYQALEAQRQAAVADVSAAATSFLNNLQRLKEQQAQTQTELTSAQEALETQERRVEDLARAPDLAPSNRTAPAPFEPVSTSGQPEQTTTSRPLNPSSLSENATPGLASRVPPRQPPPVPQTPRQGPNIGRPIPLSSTPLPTEAPQGRRPKQETTVLGGGGSRRNAQGLQPLRPLGAMGEFAAFQSAQQQDRQNSSSSEQPRKHRAVTDVPQKKWANSDEDTEGVDGDEEDEGERPNMAEQVETANDTLGQLQGDSSDVDGYGSTRDDSAPDDGTSGENEGSAGSAQTEQAGTSTQSSPDRPSSRLGQLLHNRNAPNDTTDTAAKSASADKTQKLQAERMNVVRKEMRDKFVDVVGLGGFEAIVPVLTYAGRVMIVAVNRRAGFFSMKMLPGYRPNLPKGVAPSSIEQSWNLVLDFEVFAAFMGLFTAFILILGILVFMFFYYFGPILAVIDAFCTIFNRTCNQ